MLRRNKNRELFENRIVSSTRFEWCDGVERPVRLGVSPDVSGSVRVCLCFMFRMSVGGVEWPLWHEGVSLRWRDAFVVVR